MKPMCTGEAQHDSQRHIHEELGKTSPEFLTFCKQPCPWGYIRTSFSSWNPIVVSSPSFSSENQEDARCKSMVISSTIKFQSWLQGSGDVSWGMIHCREYWSLLMVPSGF
jgi:hypothetical protein